jgi:hypothetical protein
MQNHQISDSNHLKERLFKNPKGLNLSGNKYIDIVVQAFSMSSPSLCHFGHEK